MISVIVPVYNVEPYLHQSLDSIRCQTCRDLDILLIDDGSTDKCGAICDEYAKKDPRIRVFHTENKGLSAARNLGLREAKGEHIGFIDSDDWIDPEMYERLLRRMEETGTDISACGVWREYRNCKERYSMDEGVYTGIETIGALVNNLTNAVWNKLYRKDCWADIRFPENRAFEEIATLYKVALKADSLSCVPTPLYHYRIRLDGIVRTRSTEYCMDYWDAFYGRYSYLIAIPEVKENPGIVDRLEKQEAIAALKTWICFSVIPKERRDPFFLQSFSGFVRRVFPPFGKKKWGVFLRAGIFFCRYTNDVVFAALHLPVGIYFLVKDIIKKPFPSCSRRNGVKC